MYHKKQCTSIILTPWLSHIAYLCINTSKWNKQNLHSFFCLKETGAFSTSPWLHFQLHDAGWHHGAGCFELITKGWLGVQVGLRVMRDAWLGKEGLMSSGFHSNREGRGGAEVRVLPWQQMEHLPHLGWSCSCPYFLITCLVVLVGLGKMYQKSLLSPTYIPYYISS